MDEFYEIDKNFIKNEAYLLKTKQNLNYKVFFLIIDYVFMRANIHVLILL
jgi:hypothetical protein